MTIYLGERLELDNNMNKIMQIYIIKSYLLSLTSSSLENWVDLLSLMASGLNPVILMVPGFFLLHTPLLPLPNTIILQYHFLDREEKANSTFPTARLEHLLSVIDDLGSVFQRLSS